MEYMNDDELNVIPFNQFIWKTSNQSSIHSLGKEEPWIVGENCMIVGPSKASYEEKYPIHSIKKAVFTILLPSTQIVIVNPVACQLLNYSSDELCLMQLHNIVHENSKYKLLTIGDGQMFDSNESLHRKDKMVELTSKDGDIIPASISFKKLTSPQQCLAIADPIDRKTTLITVDKNGKILNCDEEISKIFEYESLELIGTNVRILIPCIYLEYDKDNKSENSYRKQMLTGRKKSGIVFPLCLTISRNVEGDENFSLLIWVYLNLSGLIILNRDFRISNCNYKFLKLLFGSNKEHIVNQDIATFIPNFYEDIQNISCNVETCGRNKNRDSSSRNGCGMYKSPFPPSRKPPFFENDVQWREFSDLPTICSNCKRSSYPEERRDCRKGSRYPYAASLNLRLSKSDHDIHSSGCETHDIQMDDKWVSSQEVEQKTENLRTLAWQYFARPEENNKVQFCGNLGHVGTREGYFSGYGKHMDGNDIDIFYKVKIISFGDKLFYCLWVSKDCSDTNDASFNISSNDRNSFSINGTSADDCTTKDGSCNEELTTHSSASILSHNEELLTAGEYSERYTNIEQIGKGAFGYVKLAFRHSDGLLVVTKFIKKYKISVQSWMYDPKWKTKVPLEISLLTSLRHPNIVEILDVFHNESFFQMVMKKHGAGMDLFEFIERKPKSDEKLNSYIFRQIISAVQYLDSIGILHRDIKDENVIINERFEVKVIDFGSAAFRPPGKMFSVFYGTVEYCSPEVLQGNRYRGPELEIWSLGVTLYVLTFGESPFYDVQETIRGKFSIPSPISSYLFDLIHKMLDKNIDSRISIDRVVSHPWITQPVDINNYRFEDVVHCSIAEADPPRYITEFTFDKECIEDRTLDQDCDGTIASSNSFCSLQTTENFDQFDEKFKGSIQSCEFPIDSAVQLSTPVNSCTHTLRSERPNQGEMAKSAVCLNRLMEKPSNLKCDLCNFNDSVKKRFSLDLNVLHSLIDGDDNDYSGSDDGSYDKAKAVSSQEHFNDRLESSLVDDLYDMRLATNRSKRRQRRSYLYSSDSNFVYPYGKSLETRERNVSTETEESNLTAYPEFYTSDSTSLDGDSEFFWDAVNDKSKNFDDY